MICSSRRKAHSRRITLIAYPNGAQDPRHIPRHGVLKSDFSHLSSTGWGWTQRRDGEHSRYETRARKQGLCPAFITTMIKLSIDGSCDASSRDALTPRHGERQAGEACLRDWRDKEGKAVALALASGMEKSKRFLKLARYDDLLRWCT